jgi:hypothetical protein
MITKEPLTIKIKASFLGKTNEAKDGYKIAMQYINKKTYHSYYHEVIKRGHECEK